MGVLAHEEVNGALDDVKGLVVAVMTLTSTEDHAGTCPAA